MKIKKKITKRGFSLIEFNDFYDVKCNIQHSSLALIDAIWIGAEDIGLKKHVKGKFTNVDLSGDENTSYIANNRMHLTQDQVKALLPTLKHFAKTGELKLIKK
jgi:hypothetical protein